MRHQAWSIRPRARGLDWRRCLWGSVQRHPAPGAWIGRLIEIRSSLFDRLAEEIFSRDKEVCHRALSAIEGISPSSVKSKEDLDRLLRNIEEIALIGNAETRRRATICLKHLKRIRKSLFDDEDPSALCFDFPVGGDGHGDRANRRYGSGQSGSRDWRAEALGVLASSKDERKLILAIAVLQQKGKGADIDEVAPFLYHQNRRVRRRAVEFIAGHGAATQVAELLVPVLDDGDKKVRAYVTAALQKVNPVILSGHIEKLFEDSRLAVRKHALNALCAIDGGPEFVELLGMALADNSPVVRRLAVKALDRYRDDNSLELLKTALSDKDRQVRGKARELLMKIDPDEVLSIETLPNSRTSVDPDEAWAASRAARLNEEFERSRMIELENALAEACSIEFQPASGLSGPSDPAVPEAVASETGPAESSGLSGPSDPAVPEAVAPETGPVESSGLSGPSDPAVPEAVAPETGPVESAGISGPSDPAVPEAVASETGPAESSGLSGPSDPAVPEAVAPETGPVESAGMSGPSDIGNSSVFEISDAFAGTADFHTEPLFVLSNEQRAEIDKVLEHLKHGRGQSVVEIRSKLQGLSIEGMMNLLQAEYRRIGFLLFPLLRSGEISHPDLKELYCDVLKYQDFIIKRKEEGPEAFEEEEDGGFFGLLKRKLNMRGDDDKNEPGKYEKALLRLENRLDELYRDIGKVIIGLVRDGELGFKEAEELNFCIAAVESSILKAKLEEAAEEAGDD